MGNNKLDCLLISPPLIYRGEGGGDIWKEVESENFPPLSLAYLAGYVRSERCSVEIVDLNSKQISVDKYESFFKKEYTDKYNTIRIIGITAMTSNIKKAYEIAKITKKHFPDSLIVFGGVHPTVASYEVIKRDYVDIVVKGEGEITLKEIVAGKDLSEIDGIVYKDERTNLKENNPRARINDLDSLPMPAYDLLPIEQYRPAIGAYKQLPAMCMITTRGCPGRCTFCSKTLGTQFVFKSAEKIYEEIVYLIENYGIKQILFYDDTFTVHKKNVIKLCELMIENNLNITWTCFARVDFIDVDMLIKMKHAGCHQIMYGVESIDKTVLKNINKNINVNQVINVTKWTKQVGIECRLAFMVGNPGDNEQSILNNIKFVNKVNPDLLIVNITTPFPGTVMFDWAKEKGLILTYDWDDYNLAKPVMELENLNSDQIMGLYRLMYRRFYFRPKFIIRKIMQFRSKDDFKHAWAGLTALVSFFKPKKYLRR